MSLVGSLEAAISKCVLMFCRYIMGLIGILLLSLLIAKVQGLESATQNAESVDNNEDYVYLNFTEAEVHKHGG